MMTMNIRLVSQFCDLHLESQSNSNSSGPTRNPATSLSPNTPGSSRPSTTIPSLSSEQMLSDTSCLLTMVESTSTLTTAATDASTLSSPIPLGSAEQFQLVSRTTRWAQSPNILSSSRQSIRSLRTPVTGACRI
jgi:hypothetical protein